MLIQSKKYLTALGVSESQIRTVSYGEEKPMDKSRTDVRICQKPSRHFGILIGPGLNPDINWASLMKTTQTGHYLFGPGMLWGAAALSQSAPVTEYLTSGGNFAVSPT